MLLKIFNMGHKMKEKKRFSKSYKDHEIISHTEDLFKDHKKGLKTQPVINGSGAFSTRGGELYSMALTGFAALKERKNQRNYESSLKNQPNCSGENCKIYRE